MTKLRSSFLTIFLCALILMLASPTRLLAQEVTQPGSAILVWLGTGNDPEDFKGEAPGSLAFLQQDGTFQPLMELPARTERVVPAVTAASRRMVARSSSWSAMKHRVCSIASPPP